MKVNGIIAEYNPFHNGHRYQADAAKKLTGAEYTVVCMSGNFVQRGAPALTEKHVRAEMALRSGVDLVLELPAPYASGSAEYFAMGATALLRRLGVVTHLCFGSECGDIDILRLIAQTLSDEPEAFRTCLKSRLREGSSFPAARAEALSSCLPELAGREELLSSPNNILGIEYIKALLKQGSSIRPVTVKRTGAGYHEYAVSRETISESPELPPVSPGHTSSCHLSAHSVDEPDIYASATGSRRMLLAGEPFSGMRDCIPPEASEVMERRLEKHPPLREDDLSVLLYYRLLAEQNEGYERYADVSKELSDRIRNRLNDYCGFENFCDLLKTRELTRSRISRCLLHIILNITDADYDAYAGAGYAPYARVLGFRRDASGLLSAIKANTEIPLITKLADGESLLSPETAPLLRKENRISQLYHGLAASKIKGVPENEYTLPVVIV